MANGTKANGVLRPTTITALDIGTSKVACLIVRTGANGSIRVIGVGQRPLTGMRGGVIVNVESVRDAVANAAQVAESMAGETARGVVASVGCGRPQSETLSIEVPLGGHEVSTSDIRKVMAQGRRVEGQLDRELLHAIPVGFRIDDTRGVRDPRGLFGDILGAEIHTITAESGPVRTLASCLAGCHLEAESFVVSPYASGLATLVEDEMQLGATVIDAGSGVTDIAVFQQGELVYADSIPIGGAHVTNDIAHGLSTPIEHAERIKLLYGAALQGPSDDTALVEVPPIGAENDVPMPVPKSLLTGIIKPRVEEMLELARARLEASGFSGGSSRRIVLTGGASQMRGIRELASSIFDSKVRSGRAYRLDGLAESATGPTFATCTGLIRYAARQLHDTDGFTAALGSLSALQKQSPQDGMFRRVGSWFQEHFYT
jgi:cell division protein FtsA